MVALFVCATLEMGAMPMVETNIHTEITPRIEYVSLGTVTAYMNAGEDEVFIPNVSGITGIMPGVLHWSPAQGGIIVSQLFKAFPGEIETPGAHFVIELAVSSGNTTGIYTVNVYVQ